MRKPTGGRVNQAAKKAAEAQAAKRTVVFKPGVKRVVNPNHPQAPITGLPLREMLRETTSRTKQLMREGDVTVVGLRASKTGRVIYSQTVTRHKTKPPTSYKQAVRNEDKAAPTFSKSRRLKVYCTCPRFKFAHDWTLHQEEASDLKFSIDEPSLITNPQQLHGVCKHLLSLFNVVVKSKR